MDESGESKFNKLEREIFKWFIEKYNDENLSSQIERARLKKRTWTKAGFWIEIELPLNLKPVDGSKYEHGGYPIKGPAIESVDIEDGGGSALYLKNGYVDWLELFANGQKFAQDVKSFELL